MLIDFAAMEEQIIPHMRGGEKEAAMRIHTDDMGKIMKGRLIPGASIGLHTHETNCEIIYVLEGTGKVLCDGAYEPLAAGSCHYCPKGHANSLINDSAADLIFFAVVPEQQF